MTRSRRFFASSPWIATGTPDYVNLGYTSRGLAKQALMRLSRKSLAIFRKLGLAPVNNGIAMHSMYLDKQGLVLDFDCWSPKDKTQILAQAARPEPASASKATD